MTAPILAAHKCSKWYGQVLGVSDIDLEVGGGIVGLLGPNGAGKSTLMKLMAGLLRPSRGSLTVLGEAPHGSRETRRRIGYCPEHDGLYDELSALELVTAMAALAGLPGAEARRAAERRLGEMGLADAQHRRVKGFSKGMRQRTKLAQAMAHDPEVLLLDEPLTGVDPVARADITERIRDFAGAGGLVILSSHVLYEIEALTDEILVIHRGRVLAEGNVYRIRELIDHHPHTIRVECERPRELGRELAAAEHVLDVRFEPDAVVVQTASPDQCYDLIAEVALARELPVRALSSPDNNLGAVFSYLTTAGGAK